MVPAREIFLGNIISQTEQEKTAGNWQLAIGNWQRQTTTTNDDGKTNSIF
jgi:hypothetical protein